MISTNFVVKLYPKEYKKVLIYSSKVYKYNTLIVKL